jgi:hypothetical protein
MNLTFYIPTEHFFRPWTTVLNNQPVLEINNAMNKIFLSEELAR